MKEPKKYEVPEKLLDDIIKYIEVTESLLEWERGLGRSLKEVIDDGDMPDIYYTLKALKE